MTPTDPASLPARRVGCPLFHSLFHSLPGLVAATLVTAAASSALAVHADGEASARVKAAIDLVDRLDLSRTDYAHGQGSVTWDGVVASHTDCSGFIDHLLTHVDGYSASDFKRWFGSSRPTAERYHDAILEGRGFTKVASVTDLAVGDVIAIKYLTRHDNTGHIMLVVEPPRPMDSSPPMVGGTRQFAVTVVDSSESGHGPSDTRHHRGNDGRDHDGLGRGIVRLYTNPGGDIAGFSWSTAKVSRFIGPQDEHVVLGRFVDGYRP